MRVTDKPGVLADITRILADSKISIDAMVQKEPGKGEKRVDIVMLTHQALEKNVNQAIARIEKLSTVVGARDPHPAGRAAVRVGILHTGS